MHRLYHVRMVGAREEVVARLNSRYAREQMEGMHHIIALMSSGQDASHLFPQVVKQVVSKSFEVKKLVYTYLVKYAEGRPDDALMCINEFQKALNDRNPLVRAMALRVMSSIRVHMVVQIVMIAIRQCAVDASPYVRKAAAHAVPKVFNIDRDRLDELLEVLATLVKDRAPMVLGSVAHALAVVCPDRLDLLHEPYRRICRCLPDLDEWGQTTVLNLLHRYARTYFKDPAPAWRAGTCGRSRPASPSSCSGVSTSPLGSRHTWGPPDSG